MHRTGVITVDADRLAAAAEKVESLGCVVRQAHALSAGKYDLHVDLPTIEAGDAVAWAVARGEIAWRRDHAPLRESHIEISIDRETIA